MKTYEKNILKVFHRSTSAEITNGIYWYDNANRIAKELSVVFSIPETTACLVISALSPNNSWTRNISDAWKVCKCWYTTKTWDDAGKIASYAHCVTCTYSANKQKAFDILNGKLLDLNGLKTQNFARNLNGCLDSVTVDVHAFSIVKGKRFTAKDMKAIKPRDYTAIADAYRTVAKTLEVKPAQLQAICWATWRRLHGLTTHQELTGKLF